MHRQRAAYQHQPRMECEWLNRFISSPFDSFGLDIFKGSSTRLRRLILCFSPATTQSLKSKFLSINDPSSIPSYSQKVPSFVSHREVSFIFGPSHSFSMALEVSEPKQVIFFSDSNVTFFPVRWS